DKSRPHLVAVLWMTGRVLVLTPLGWSSAVVNAAFPVAVAVGIGMPLLRAGNRRNYFFIALLLVMAAAVFVLHLAQLGVFDVPGWLGAQIGLDVVCLSELGLVPSPLATHALSI